MHSLVSILALAFTAAKQTLASPLTIRADQVLPAGLPNRQLFHWPNGTWVENISVRPNGNLLVTTSTPTGSVWQISEPWSDTPKVEHVYDFEEWVDRLIGIGESTPDKYVVVGSRFYHTGPMSSQVERTFAAMELDFSGNVTKPTARLISWFPEAYLLQSVTNLPWDPSTVLISDQYLLNPRLTLVDLTPSPGQIWRLDTITGESVVVAADKAEFNTTYAHGLDVGIEGVHIKDDILYFLNQDDGGIYKLPIDKKGVPIPPGNPIVVAKFDTLWDDFAFGPTGDTLWATGFNAVFAVSMTNGTVVPIAGVGTGDVSTNTSFPGPTACQFGRHGDDANILYVTGNLLHIPSSLDDLILGGWVRAIDTTGFSF